MVKRDYLCGWDLLGTMFNAKYIPSPLNVPPQHGGVTLSYKAPHDDDGSSIHKRSPILSHLSLTITEMGTGQEVLFCKWRTRITKVATCLYLNRAGRQQSWALKSPVLTSTPNGFLADRYPGNPLTHFIRVARTVDHQTHSLEVELGLGEQKS